MGHEVYGPTLQEEQPMESISKFFHFLSTGPSRDNAFESYYGALARSRNVGGPSASEARRDFEVIRRTVDKAILY